jgi:transcriptional regulator with XRE-family HTH domain
MAEQPSPTVLGAATRSSDSSQYRTVLQRERCRRGWTQQEAIDRLKRLAYEQGHGRRFDGLDVNTLSRYEHGRIRRPRPPLPALFAALYQVPVEELFPSVARPVARQPRRRLALALVPAAGNATPAGEPARVVLTVEELGAIIAASTAQAVQACLSAFASSLRDNRSPTAGKPCP